MCRYVGVSGGQKATLGDILQSLLTIFCFDSLRQSLIDLELAKEAGRESQGLPCIYLPGAGIIKVQHTTMPSFPMCILGSDSGPRALYQLGLPLLIAF